MRLKKCIYIQATKSPNAIVSTPPSLFAKMSALFFAGVRFGSLRTAVPVPSRTSTSFKLLSPLSSNTYRTIGEIENP